MTLAAALAASLGAQRAASRESSRGPTRAEPAKQEPAELRILDPATPPGRRHFDGVIAMVGDHVILHSTIRAAVGAVVEGELGANRTVSRSAIVDQAYFLLRLQIRDEVLAQTARFTDQRTPSELKEVLNAELQRYLQEQIASVGSYNQYLALLEDAQTPWEEVAQRHTAEVLQQLSDAQILANVRTRTGNRSSLWVTPREMRNFYEQNKGLFQRERSVTIERILFSDSPAKAKAQAEAAAARWRAEPGLEPEALAQAYPGATQRPSITVTPNDDSHQFLKDFARDAKLMQVSNPILVGGEYGNYMLLRVRRLQEGLDPSFSDPEVQKSITERLVKIEVNRLRQRLYERNALSLFLFIQPELWRL